MSGLAKSTGREVAVEEVPQGIAVNVTTLGADQLTINADHPGNFVGGGAERTVEVRLGTVNEQTGNGIGGKSGNPPTVAKPDETAVCGNANKASESNGETIGETIAVSVIEDVKPIEKKHGDSYGLGFLIGISVTLAITYAVFRKKSNRRD